MAPTKEVLRAYGRERMRNARTYCARRAAELTGVSYQVIRSRVYRRLIVPVEQDHSGVKLEHVQIVGLAAWRELELKGASTTTGRAAYRTLVKLRMTRITPLLQQGKSWLVVLNGQVHPTLLAADECEQFCQSAAKWPSATVFCVDVGAVSSKISAELAARKW